jgi:hypothetical protein
VWGGSTTIERAEALRIRRNSALWLGEGRRQLVADAVDLPEATLHERLEGWRAKRAAIDPEELPGLMRRERNRAALLLQRYAPRAKPVKRFEQGNPGGPGRGHRGPIALLAAELGCSRSTAWRRLKSEARNIGKIPKPTIPASVRFDMPSFR